MNPLSQSYAAVSVEQPWWKGRLKKLGLVADRPDQAMPRLQAFPIGAPSHDRRTRIELANGISIEAPHDIDGDALCMVLRAALAVPII